MSWQDHYNRERITWQCPEQYAQHLFQQNCCLRVEVAVLKRTSHPDHRLCEAELLLTNCAQELQELIDEATENDCEGMPINSVTSSLIDDINDFMKRG